MKRLLLFVAFLLTVGISYGQTNYAAVFNNGNYASAPVTDAENFTTGTIEFWMRPNANIAAQCPVSMYGTTGGKMSVFLMSNFSDLDMWTDLDWFRVSAFTYKANTWYHVALVMKSSTVDYYVNGTLIGTYTAKINPNTGNLTQLILGASFAKGENFTGFLDEMRFWNVQRTQADIQANMNQPLTLPQTGLVAYYKFDDMGGANTFTTRDYSGNARTATFNVGSTAVPAIVTSSNGNIVKVSTSTLVTVGTVPFSTINKVELYNGTTKVDEISTSPYTFNISSANIGMYYTKVTDVSGNITSSVAFEGVSATSNSNFAVQSEGITIPSNTAFDFANGGTISLWANPTFNKLSGNARGLVASNKTTKRFSIQMLQAHDGLGLWDGDWKTISYNFVQNHWYNITFVLTTNGVDAYVNGVKIGTFANGKNMTVAGNGLQIGLAGDNWDMFPGLLDEVKVWSVQKTAAEVMDLYTTNATPTTGLEGYWNFNDLAAVATDLSGKGRNGTYNKIAYVKLPSVIINSATPYFTPNASLNITADASSTSTSISKVEIYSGSTLLTTKTSAPYTFNYTGLTLGATYAIKAVATDNLGNVNTSDVVNVTITNTPPTISLAATAIQATPVTLTATATDSDGAINKVDFYNGNTLIGTVTTAPYTYKWTGVANGVYTFTAVAYDNLNATATSSSAIVTVKTAPTVVVSTPVTGASYTNPSLIALSATAASNTTTSINTVKFYLDGAVLGTAALNTTTTNVYTFNWTSNFTIGVHALTAIATDADGIASTSVAVSVEIKTQLPIATILTTNVTSTTKAPANFTITVSATDPDGTVSKVMFYDGATKLGETLATTTQIVGATSNFTFQATGITGGIHNLTAVAVDNLSASGTVSAIYTVNILPNTPSVVSIIASATSIKTNGSVTISGTASDVDVLTNVKLYQNGALITTATSSFTTTLSNLAAGVYTFNAIATDALGATTAISTVVTVNALVAPTATLVASASNVTIGTAVVATVTAGDNDGGVASVILYNNNVQVGTTLTAAPYTFNINTATAGSYSLKAVAIDVDGLLTSSNVVSVVVTVPNVKPTITLTQTTVGKVVTLSATATDTDGNISSVVFYDGTTALGTATVASSTSVYTFQTSNLAVGTHSITAVATDNSNETTVSNAVSVIITSVDNQTSNLEVKFYPNPFKSILNVEVNGAFEYTIVDLKGSVIEKGIARDKAEIGSNIQSGFYLLNIKQNGTSKTVKIEKQ